MKLHVADAAPLLGEQVFNGALNIAAALLPPFVVLACINKSWSSSNSPRLSVSRGYSRVS